jgi:zinc/manganese transport system substrate-binding protein
MVLALASGCGAQLATIGPARPGAIPVVAAENEYADVAAQVGGPYVSVSAIEDNPGSDPHSFEASPSVARALAAARVAVQNGVGYDAFMEHIESATGGSARTVIDVGKLLHLPASTPNPHLWYSPATMPALAGRLAEVLGQIQPAHRTYFHERAQAFVRSLAPWVAALARLARRDRGALVASSEPLVDYLLAPAGAHNLTPWALQADVMNGVDPAPQLVSREQSLLSGRRVKALVYNQQVTDTLTQRFRETAERAGVPVVAAYETMPRGYHYQSWMLAELGALRAALTEGRSTPKL